MAPAVFRKKLTPISIGILGQSWHLGNVLDSDRGAYPQAFSSLTNLAVSTPISPSQVATNRGGYWFKVYDDLREYGYDPVLVNGAIGGISFLRHVAGTVQARANSSNQYSNKRASFGYPDRGDFGDLIKPASPNDTRVFQVTSGAGTLGAINATPLRDGGLAGTQDYITGIGSGGSTAASEPAGYASSTIGGTVTDGGVTVTRLNEALYAGLASGVLTESNGGFDRLGVLARLDESMRQVPGVERKFIDISHGQADLGTGPVTYAAVLVSIGTYYLKRGYEVLVGLTGFSPGSSGANSTNYNNLSTGVANAITTLSASYPGKVHAGANLWTSMGSTGPMAAGGAFMQSDNIHLNGAGCVGPDLGGISCAATYITNSYKAILPDRRPLILDRNGNPAT